MKTRGYAFCTVVVLVFFGFLQFSGTRAAMGFLAGKSGSPIPNYEIADLGDIGNNQVYPCAINNAGQVVGYYRRGGTGTTSQLFTWLKGSFSYPLGSDGESVDINDSGEIAGGDRLPAVWRDGIAVFLEIPDGEQYGTAAAINNVGQVVGSVRESLHGPSRAVLWEDGAAVELSNLEGSDRSRAVGINERGQIIGISIVDSQSRAVLWEKDGSIIDLGEGSAVAINNSGQMLVNGPEHPLLLDKGMVVDLSQSFPGEHLGGASAINNSGQVVGSLDNSPVLWEDGKGYYLIDLIPSDSGWAALNRATDINDRGQIVGSGVTTNGKIHAFLMTRVRHQARGGGK